MRSSFEQRNQIEEALVFYRKILDLQSNHVRANVANAERYKQLGNDSEYLKALQPLFNDANQKVSSKINVIRPLIVKFAENPNCLLRMIYFIIGYYAEASSGF